MQIFDNNLLNLGNNWIWANNYNAS